MKLDITLRSLAGTGSPALIRQIAGAGAVADLPTEFPNVRDRRVDTLVRLEDGRILHLEWQSVPDAAMPRRMLWYWLLITEAHPGVPLEQVVVQIGNAPRVPDRLDTGTLSFRYRVIDSRDLDPAPLLDSPAVEDNILAILSGRDHLTARIAAILARIAPLEERERRDALTRLMVLAGSRGFIHLVLEEVKDMPIHIDVSQDPYLSELARRNWVQGKAEGRVEGKAEGEALILIRLVERRFGPLAPELRERVLSAEPAVVEGWADRLFEAGSLDALFGDRSGN